MEDFRKSWQKPIVILYRRACVRIPANLAYLCLDCPKVSLFYKVFYSIENSSKRVRLVIMQQTSSVIRRSVRKAQSTTSTQIESSPHAQDLKGRESGDMNL